MSLSDQADIPQQMQAASAAWTKLRRMAAYASFDGWSLAVLGALSLVCGGYGSVPELLVSISLLGTGVFEIVNVQQLRRLNPVAINRLAYNQIVLAAFLILYAVTGLILNRTRGGTLSPEAEQLLADGGASTAELKPLISTGYSIMYFVLIVFTLLAQGGTAIFYLSRRKYLHRYMEETPAWIQQMQRERGAVSI